MTEIHLQIANTETDEALALILLGALRQARAHELSPRSRERASLQALYEAIQARVGVLDLEERLEREF